MRSLLGVRRLVGALVGRGLARPGTHWSTSGDKARRIQGADKAANSKEGEPRLQNFEMIDLSHTVEHGMITYKGLPAPVISDFLSREKSESHYATGTQFHIAKIEMVANTGTYLDSPFHRYPEGKDLAGLELTSLANLDCIVVRKVDSQERAISVDDIRDLNVANKAVLFHSGWDRHWRTEKYSDGSHPFLTRDAAEHLSQTGALLVGIDSYNIDDTAALDRPAHSILLAHDIPIVEHLCHLDRLPDEDFKFFAVPVKVKDFGTFPVRAFAVVPKKPNG